MNYKFTSQRVDLGMSLQSPLRNCTTEAQVNQTIAGRDIVEDVAVCTEAQIRGIHHYIRAVATGLDTSSVETAISAVI